MRKSPAQRVEEYRTKAAQIEERERRKLLGRSPHWLAIKRAIVNLELALSCCEDEKLGDLVEEIRNQLVVERDATVG